MQKFLPFLLAALFCTSLLAEKSRTKAPDYTAKDTNPTSATFNKNVSTKDFKGFITVWIHTFDCDC